MSRSKKKPARVPSPQIRCGFFPSLALGIGRAFRFENLKTTMLRSAILGGGIFAGVALADSRNGPTTADCQLALQAKNTLWDQSPFDKLNLGVTVRDGVATVSGPVPSTAVGDQAIALLRTIRGVRDVRNETFVPSSDEPMAMSMPHPVTAERPSFSVGPAVAPPKAVISPPPPAAVAVAPPRTTTESLSPAIAIPVKRMTLLEQVEAVRLADRRFQNVRIELKDGVVILRGTVAHSADAWEFATTLRQIPGVTGVVQSTETRSR